MLSGGRKKNKNTSWWPRHNIPGCARVHCSEFFFCSFWRVRQSLSGLNFERGSETEPEIEKINLFILIDSLLLAI